MAIRALPLCLATALIVAACSDSSVDYPALLPTDPLLAEPAIPGHAEIAASSPDQVRSDLEAAGAGLAVSSAQVAAETIADDQSIADRAAALRRRAAAIAATDPGCENPTDPASC